jgi:hypothetical protein
MPPAPAAASPPGTLLIEIIIVDCYGCHGDRNGPRCLPGGAVLAAHFTHPGSLFLP